MERAKTKADTELYSLIDRLQACSKINHPTRLWSNEFYYECAFQWMDNIPGLRSRVEKLEAEIEQKK